MDETSAIIAILSETFPLLIPPINRAKINKTKLFDKHHKTYEIDIPICNEMYKWRPVSSARINSLKKRPS